jgi:hypothetical protein
MIWFPGRKLFMVGQSHDRFTLLNVKDVISVISALSAGHPF